MRDKREKVAGREEDGQALNAHPAHNARPDQLRDLGRPDRLLSLGDAASHLRVSERTIRREVSAKRLHCVRIGRRLLFDPADVSRFVAARKE